MAIYATNKKKDFQPAPEGLQRCVCCDVVDLGVIETKFGRKRMVYIAWQSEELRDDGKPFLIMKRYTPSLHKKANLRRDLESWRGKPFTEEEASELDLESLLSKNCQLNIVHNTGDDGTIYANVSAIVPAARGAAPLVVRDYERVCKREGYVAPEPEEQEHTDAWEGEGPDAESEVPF